MQWDFRNLTKYRGTKFEYNAQGLRTSKQKGQTKTSYTWAGDKLIAETRKWSDCDIQLGDQMPEGGFYIYANYTDITYLYGLDGIQGFTLQNDNETPKKYWYLKNIFGDVEGIYDSEKNCVARYCYDAFGNHKVLNPDGTENADTHFIGNVNSMRYRSYYYDTTTKLYYLKSRYYDSETGRYINMDDISEIEPDRINGLNLYTYCANNWIMNIDPNGNSFWSWLKKAFVTVATIALVVVAVVGLMALATVTAGAGFALLGVAIGAAASGMAAGAIVGGVTALISGESLVGGILGGAIRGFATGAAIGLGIMFGAGGIGLVPGLLGALSLNYLAGNLAYVVENATNGREITWKGAMISGGLQAATSVFAFATGGLLGDIGAYNLPGQLMNTLKTEGLKAFTSVVVRNIIGSMILKAAIFWPIAGLLRGIQKQNR